MNVNEMQERGREGVSEAGKAGGNVAVRYLHRLLDFLILNYLPRQRTRLHGLLSCLTLESLSESGIRKRNALALGGLFFLVVIGCVVWRPGIIAFQDSNDLRIDPSALISMNYWFVNGGILGQDVVGPYASLQFIRFGLYWPGLFAPLIIGRILHAAALAAAAWWFMGRVGAKGLIVAFASAWMLVWSTKVTGTDASFDILYLLLVYMHGMDDRKRPSLPLILITLAGAMLALAKFPAFLLLMVALSITAITDLLRGRWPVLLPVGILSFLGFWFYAGQGVGNLLPWAVTSFDISSGFNDAMSIGFADKNRLLDTAAFVATMLAFGVLHLLYLRRYWANTFSAVAAAFFLAFWCFVVFKHGIVRHDGHAAHAGATFALLAALFALIVPYGALRLREALIVIAVLVVVFSTNVYMTQHWSFHNAGLMRTPGAFVAAVTDMFALPKTVRSIEDAHEAQVRRFKTMAGDLPSSGTIDAWPDNAALAIFSGAKYDPRPTPFAFSSYSAALSGRNAAFLDGPSAPDNLVFEVGTIDYKIPTVDDPLSWRAIMANYDLVDEIGGRLLMKKRSTPRTYDSKDAGEAVIGWEQPVPLKAAEGGLVWAEVDIQKTLLGRLVTFLYKAPSIVMSMHLKNGEVVDYRIVPDVIREGFFISPRIAVTADFIQLYLGGQGGGAPADVESVSFKIVPDFRAMYRDRIKVRFNTLRFDPGFTVDEDVGARLKQFNVLASLEREVPPENLRFVRLVSLPDSPERVLLAHASTTLVLPVEGQARQISLEFGMLPASYTGTDGDGVRFSVVGEDGDGNRVELASRYLNPAHVTSDRGRQHIDIPALPAGLTKILLMTGPGSAGNTAWDQSYWSRIDLR